MDSLDDLTAQNYVWCHADAIGVPMKPIQGRLCINFGCLSKWGGQDQWSPLSTFDAQPTRIFRRSPLPVGSGFPADKLQPARLPVQGDPDPPVRRDNRRGGERVALSPLRERLDKPLSMFLEPPIAYLQSEKKYADSRTSMVAICMGSNLMSIGCSNAYLVDQNEIGNEEANNEMSMSTPLWTFCGSLKLRPAKKSLFWK
ncbi:hypothetical protein B0H14DRAFT_2586899 [Mycena olivaceomarginata]|nr:hypothetical protein B0H14DRAFT_2586899 [Mycena olivaceomarginata]